MRGASTLHRLSRLLLQGQGSYGTAASGLAEAAACRTASCIATADLLQAMRMRHTCSPTGPAAQSARRLVTDSHAAGAGATAAATPSVPAAASAGATAHRSGGGSTGGSGSGGGRSMGPILLLPAVVAAGLGSWQLARRSEKIAMLEDRLAAMRAEPVDIFTVTERLPEFTPVTAEGQFDEQDTIFIGPRVRSAMGGTIKGKVVVTPLRDPHSGSVVLVNRGWAPEDYYPDTKESTRTVRMEGLTRHSEPRGGFVPDNVPGSGPRDPKAQWYWLDAPAMARAAGLPPDTPLVEAVVDEKPREAASAAREWPIASQVKRLTRDPMRRDAGPTAMEILGGRVGSLGNSPLEYPAPKTREEMLQFSVMPQGHLNYAATWFTLSAFTAGAALLAMRRGRRPIHHP